MSYKIKSIRVYPHVKDDPDRYTPFDDDDWDGPVVSLEARADVTLCLASVPKGWAPGPKFRSMGLYGIQVQSVRDPYLAEIYEAELEDLFDQFAAFGISRDQCEIEQFPCDTNV